MKSITKKLTKVGVVWSILVFLGGWGMIAAAMTQPSIHFDSTEWQFGTAQEHVRTAEDLERTIAGLEEKVVNIDQKLVNFDRKPYLDPKRFRRDGLKILKGTTLEKMASLREQLAWHRAEATRLASLEELQSENDSDSVTTGQIFDGEKEANSQQS